MLETMRECGRAMVAGLREEFGGYSRRTKTAMLATVLVIGAVQAYATHEWAKEHPAHPAPPQMGNPDISYLTPK